MPFLLAAQSHKYARCGWAVTVVLPPHQYKLLVTFAVLPSLQCVLACKLVIMNINTAVLSCAWQGSGCHWLGLPRDTVCPVTPLTLALYIYLAATQQKLFWEV